MTTNRDFDRLARAWLELGPDEAPDRVVAAVLQAAETTPQVRRPIRWPFGRPIHMNRLVLAAGAVAVLVVAVGGGVILTRGDQTGIGGPGASPTASPTVSPTPSSPPAPPSAVTLGATDAGRGLAPGDYRVGPPFSLPFRFSLESDWTLKDLSAGDFVVYGGAGDIAYVQIDVVENVFADPCHAAGGPLDPPVERTVDGVVAALSSMPAFRVEHQSGILIDGHSGVQFDLTNTLDPATAGCDDGGLIPLWTYAGGGRTSTNPGVTEHLAVIDVDGSPVVVAWPPAGQTTPVLSEETVRVVMSLDFD